MSQFEFCRRVGLSQMRDGQASGWKHIWLLTFLVLFVSRQKEHNIYIELFRGLSPETCVIKVCWLRSREAALLETQLNFVHTCPSRPKTKLGC